MHRSFGRIRCVAIALLIAAASCAPAVAAETATPRSERPAGWSDLSYYMPMTDGVRLAVSIWFPEHRVPAGKIPVILIQTRYGRGGTFTYVESNRYQRLVAAGYAVAIVDTRGSTASFGDRLVEIGPDEVRDMELLIRHFRTRPWSNGEVFATGVSYMADTADIATGAKAGLRGAIVRESDFDAYLDLFNPGGIANDLMMREWGGATIPRDYGRNVRGTESLDCGLRVEDCAKLWPRLQPVDADTGFAQIRAAIAARKHWTPADYDAVEFRDDKAKNGYTVFASSPAAYLTALKRQRVPVQYWGSWMDAGTAEAALSRYRSMPDLPMEVWLTANNHGNHQRTDPLLPLVKAPAPAFDTQFDSMIAFLARLRAGKTIERSIHYYVLGADQFRTTPVWPPADAHTTRFRFAPDRALVSAATPLADGQDRVPVDFTASSGRATRWTTQLGEAAAYPDRRDEDDKLLAYTSAPFERDMELVGTPSVHLFVASETSDPAFFVYLEDVAPDGRVTYLTEALFRAIHRKPADVAKLPYAQPQPASSFARADAMKMQPGQIAEVSFPAFPVAALLRQGHRLRVAIAGADADTFHRYSEGRDDAFTVERSTVRPSGIDVNLRPWTP